MTDLKLPSEAGLLGPGAVNRAIAAAAAEPPAGPVPGPAEALRGASDARLQAMAGWLESAQLSGVPLLEMAEKHGVTVRFEPLSGLHGYYSPRRRMIGLDATSRLSLESLTLTLAHELRHAWQHAEGLLPTAALAAADYIAAIRYIEADAKATEAQLLAEIAQQPGGAEFAARVHKPNTVDVIAVYNRAIEDDAEALSDGRARWAAFEQWPAPGAGRAQGYEKRAAEQYRAFVERGWAGNERLALTRVSALGQHGDDRNYILDSVPGGRDPDSIFSDPFLRLLTEEGRELVRDFPATGPSAIALPKQAYEPRLPAGPGML